MLVETEGLDWDKPLAYYDTNNGNGFLPALLISKNYLNGYSSSSGEKSIRYLVVVYDKEKGDKVITCTPDGREAGTAICRLFNAVYKEKAKVPEVIDEVGKKIKDLGEF